MLDWRVIRPFKSVGLNILYIELYNKIYCIRSTLKNIEEKNNNNIYIYKNTQKAVVGL
jgi:hypothetical protein